MPDIRSMPPTDEYRENWDRVFGSLPKTYTIYSSDGPVPDTSVKIYYCNGIPILKNREPKSRYGYCGEFLEFVKEITNAVE